MPLSTFAKCPHCGFARNALLIANPAMQRGAEILLCDADAGCDRYFAVFWRTQIDVTSHCIEGQEP